MRDSILGLERPQVDLDDQDWLEDLAQAEELAEAARQAAAQEAAQEAAMVSELADDAGLLGCITRVCNPWPMCKLPSAQGQPGVALLR